MAVLKSVQVRTMARVKASVARSFRFRVYDAATGGCFCRSGVAKVELVMRLAAVAAMLALAATLSARADVLFS